MPPVPNPHITFTKYAIGVVPVKNEHTFYGATRTIDLENVPLHGGFLTKTVVLSAEPFMRVRMRDSSEPAYSPVYKLGAPIIGYGVVVVLRSEDPQYKPGDYLMGATTWELYTVQPYSEGRYTADEMKEFAPWTENLDDFVLRPVANPNNAIPWEVLINAFGVPGMSAWMALKEYGDLKKGQTIFVTSGASAVGTIVVQLAKAAGLHVIASVGSDSKVATLKSLGVDVVFNYKTTDAEEVLEREPYIDIMRDNAGGKMLEVAIKRAALHGKLIICGGAAEYNLAYEERWGIRNTIEIHRRRLSLFGFYLGDLVPKHAGAFFTEMPGLVASGAIKTNEQVFEGLENGEDALLEVFRGTNEGKVIVRVSKE